MTHEGEDESSGNNRKESEEGLRRSLSNTSKAKQEISENDEDENL